LTSSKSAMLPLDEGGGKVLARHDSVTTAEQQPRERLLE
jgi:hypothetical protein